MVTVFPFVWDMFSIFVVVAVISLVFTRGIISLMAHFSMIVSKNERSSHIGNPSIGGGWPIVVLTLGVWALLAMPQDAKSLSVFASVIVLAAISWADDVRLVSPVLRILVQIVLVSLCLFLLPGDERILWNGLPLPVDRLLAGFCWLWFINLYNFMDGIDGLAASETITVGLGIVVIFALINYDGPLPILAMALAGAMAGFLWWNWHPSKIILGDLGAIPVGFLLGYLLIQLALKGQLAAAFILPLYFLLDASLTLSLRMLKGEPFSKPHREHFYQRALAAGRPHSDIVLRIMLTNVILVIAAILSLYYTAAALILAGLAMTVLFVHLGNLSKD